MAILSVGDKNLEVDFSGKLELCCIKSLKIINNALRGNISIIVPKHFEFLGMIFSFNDEDFLNFAKGARHLIVYRGEWSKLDMVSVGVRKDQIAKCRDRADFELTTYHKSGNLYGLWTTIENRFNAAQRK
jgi:hypothetical protein